MSRGTAFRALHERDEPFVMPNPWDVGSAKILASLGFSALATTSSGHAYTLGRPDGVRAVSRDEAIGHAAELAAATPLPVNGDLERGYGDDPADVAETVRLAAAAGLAGCSIEDATGDPARPIYPRDVAIARIEAAVDAARSLPDDFVLTARAENYLHGRPDLTDTIERLQAFQAVGADVLYAPRVPTLDDVRTLVAAVDRPVNALASREWTVAALAEVGVSRISIGGALAVTAFAALVRSAQEILHDGTFTYTDRIPRDLDLDDLFATLPGDGTDGAR